MTCSAPVFIVMGPSGCGKTTVGRTLASLCHLPFLEGDDFHSPEAIAKMTRGVPLTDEDRAPWLVRLARELDAADQGVVLSCSALRAGYRSLLGTERASRHLVYLAVPEAELARRLRARTGHFAGEALLASQLATLEPPSSQEIYDGTRTPTEIACAALRRAGLYP